MSVTTHAEIEECPRRWALEAAEYPELWGGRGYPPRLQVAALAGSVVHLALETITKQLTCAGVPSQDHPLAARVLKDLGGYTSVVQESVERVLKRFAGNPRAIPLLEHARRVRGQVPALRMRVQALVARLRLPAGVPALPTTGTTAAARRAPLSSGVYPEVELRARRIGWRGKADLLVINDAACEITDFKTGAPEEAHKFQVRVYALLWHLDDEINPRARAVDRLVLAYERQDVEVQPPSGQELEALGQELLVRRRGAEEALAARPPAARPSDDSCRHCGVRHLCDEYWAGATQAGSGDARFGDVELRIVRRHGPTSWDAIVLRSRSVSTKRPALLRLQQPIEFKPETRIRVLEAGLARDPEDRDALLIVTVGTFSEIYRID